MCLAVIGSYTSQWLSASLSMCLAAIGSYTGQWLSTSLSMCLAAIGSYTSQWLSTSLSMCLAAIGSYTCRICRGVITDERDWFCILYYACPWQAHGITENTNINKPMNILL